MFAGLRPRCSLAARRVFAPARQATTPASVPPRFVAPATRPLATFGSAPWQRVLAERHAAISTRALSSLRDVARTEPVTQKVLPEASQSSVQEVAGIRKQGLVFEIGITYTVMHYQTIGIAFMRGTFQSFRPLLILFIFGQILKSVFFILGAPMWFSFYSIWMFEVVYGLAQCIISFIFISFFYNNLSFARIRPTVTQMLRQQRDKLARAASLLR
mmetsp:Transcript_43493/g.114744  ORF Transcript_43493/g.114744 Transcript_43493/m.114744 type:complete len:215 (-) Transcript_43493:73-717(-)|eukprot:CAMPEP_0194483128 /NCGR_PEP_ID=MMETSP0253-20130528/4840_1 /TAXON_ID=2966 /ORGANISM="Noctiluca scintillans" /LENGTH=214 /DNA_ID=CAMNT_0039322759 /DNA_START=54 /DNA_END=698 /DNA_ORIENTATION=-